MSTVLHSLAGQLKLTCESLEAGQAHSPLSNFFDSLLSKEQLFSFAFLNLQGPDFSSLEAVTGITFSLPQEFDSAPYLINIRFQAQGYKIRINENGQAFSSLEELHQGLITLEKP